MRSLAVAFALLAFLVLPTAVGAPGPVHVGTPDLPSVEPPVEEGPLEPPSLPPPEAFTPPTPGEPPGAPTPPDEAPGTANATAPPEDAPWVGEAPGAPENVTEPPGDTHAPPIESPSPPPVAEVEETGQGFLQKIRLGAGDACLACAPGKDYAPAAAPMVEESGSPSTALPPAESIPSERFPPTTAASPPLASLSPPPSGGTRFAEPAPSSGVRVSESTASGPAASATIGLLVATAAGTVIALVAAALYHLTRDRDLLSNPVRARIFAQIVARPGIGVMDISRAVGVRHQTVSHHVRRLRRAGYVCLQSHGRRWLHFPSGCGRRSDGRVLLAIARDEGAMRVLVAIAASSEVTRKELSRVVGLARSSTAWHLAKLTRAGLVRERKEGRRGFLRVDEMLFARLGAAAPVARSPARDLRGDETGGPGASTGPASRTFPA